MWKSLILTHPQPHVLVISKSKRRNLLRLLQLAGGYIVWVGFSILLLIKDNDWGALLNSFFFRLLSALPLLFFIPRAISLIRIIRKGEVFSIDKQARTISKNKQLIAGLHEVIEVQTRRISYAESSDIDYRLLIVLRNKRIITIETISNREEINAVAAQLAGFLKVAVVRKK